MTIWEARVIVGGLVAGDIDEEELVEMAAAIETGRFREWYQTTSMFQE
jgi:hypothetical protein